MADQVFNIALGRSAELYNRVDLSDPAPAVLEVVAIVTSATDAVLKDLDTLSLVLGDVNTAEATNVGYARKTLVAADIVAFAPDDANDRVNLIIPDQTWTGVAAGDNWTDLLICYRPDSASGVDTATVPMTQHDFAITADGSDISTQFNVLGFFQAS